MKVLKPVKAMIKELEAEKEPTMHKVNPELFKIHHVLKTFIEDKSNCGYGITFAKELKTQIEKRFTQRWMDRQQRRIANYLAPQYRGAHLYPLMKLHSTKEEIKDMVEVKEVDEAGIDFELEENSPIHYIQPLSL